MHCLWQHLVLAPLGHMAKEIHGLGARVVVREPVAIDKAQHRPRAVRLRDLPPSRMYVISSGPSPPSAAWPTCVSNCRTWSATVGPASRSRTAMKVSDPLRQ
jgi:hypothetical protein